MPFSPSGILQRCPHEKQRTAFFSSFSYSSPSTVRRSRISPSDCISWVTGMPDRTTQCGTDILVCPSCLSRPDKNVWPTLFGEEEERDRDDRIDGEELNAFVPIRLAVHHEEREDGHAEDDGEQFERSEEKIERMAERIRNEDEQRRDEQRDLHARLHRNVERGIHLAAPRQEDRRRMFSCVADD